MSARATKYIVIGRHDVAGGDPHGGCGCCGRGWIGVIRRVVSQHRTLAAACRAADRAHGDLGGCDGSDSLTDIARRMKPGETAEDEHADIYEHAGRQYLVLSIWATHEIAVASCGRKGDEK